MMMNRINTVKKCSGEVLRLTFLMVGLMGLVGCGSSERAGVVDEKLGDAEEAIQGSEVEEGNGAVAANTEIPKEISFNTHVQPILSEYCYQCHGFDPSTRFPEEDPLRLDIADFAFEPRGDGEPAIIAGDAEGSKVVKRMQAESEDFIMPPPEAHKEMSQAEIDIIKAWIDQGAEYQEHWAFLPPERIEPREISAELEEWVKNPIDRYVAAELEANGLAPNPVEEPHRFLRRLSFDLTGLPPTPEEIEAFERAWVEDEDGAVLEATERMLASTAYAEHMARHWLDAVRYADTHGIHFDNFRSIWPYRDWVIWAFKENMRWDQFTIEQLAGDLLEDASLDQIVATGYGRSMPTTGEGGAINEEYQAIYAQDRTDTTAAIWLGLTTSCAACHDHKFDPLTMEDVYAFNAFFNNTTMSPMDRNNAEHPPNIFVPQRSARDRLEEIEAERKSLEKRFEEHMGELDGAFVAWMDKAEVQAAEISGEQLAVHFPLDEPEGAVEGLIAGQPTAIAGVPERYKDEEGSALRLGGDRDVVVGDIPAVQGGETFSYGVRVRVEGGEPAGPLVARMDPGNGHRGWDLWFQDGRPAAHVIDQWPDRTNKIIAKEALAGKQWHHVLVTYDGSKPAGESMRMYVNGEEVEVEWSHKSVSDNIHVDVPLRFGAREPRGDSKQLLSGDVAIRDFRMYKRLLTEEEIGQFGTGSELQLALAAAPGDRTDAQKALLRRHYAAHVDPQGVEMREQLAAMDSEIERLREQGAVSLIMEERKDSEATANILLRGDYTQVGDEVLANTPEVLPPMAEDMPRNRLGLAQWLVDPANPLSARVTVNRTWYYFFGRGIVETTEDFGIMGGRPSHPALLDWLALEFVDSGWDYQHVLRQIVTSATYRQSGRIPADKLRSDPDNILLARGPRYRLDAEQIRDAALAASGLLVDEIGGPSVKPYQPEGIWEAVAMPESNTRVYKQDSGDELYRRSMYTFWKRTAPPVSMDIFDAPSRETFCVRRDRSNTPLQALVMMNDPQFVESSRVLAERALQEDVSVEERMDFVAMRLLGRRLGSDERGSLEQTLHAAEAVFGENPEEAEKLVGVGESPYDGETDVVGLAAWTLVVNQIMNLDESLTK